MATFDCGRQRYSMNFRASHQRPLRGSELHWPPKDLLNVSQGSIVSF